MKQQIAIYLRLSLEDVDKRTNSVKDESNSIAAQRLLINRHLDQNPMLRDLPRIEFCDDGFSGTNFDRPDFQRMIEMTKHGQISCIVVKDLSRFGRDYLEVGDYLEHIFPFLGIRFKSINDHYDSEKHKGKTIGMDIAFKNLIYDYYSKDLSKKVKSAMGMKQRECAFVTCVPYGYKVNPEAKHQMVIDPEPAAVVRRIFMDVISGKSCTAIAKQLNMEGIQTTSEYKGVKRRNPERTPQWTHRAVLTLIENIKYTGTMVNHMRESRFIRDKSQRRVPKEEWYIRENAHEAIVSQDEYDAAQDAIQRRRGYKRQSHDQADRVYYCGHCGGKLEKANGTVFACPFHRYQDDSPCSKVHWRKTALEEVVFEALKRQIEIVSLETTTTQKVVKKKGDDLQQQFVILSAQIDSISRDKFSYYEKYRESGISAQEYLEQKEALTTKEAALKEQLRECEARMEEAQKMSEAATEQQHTVSHMTGLSDEQLKAHMYDAIERVLVYDAESIEIVWKFNDIEADTENEAGVGA